MTESNRNSIRVLREEHQRILEAVDVLHRMAVKVLQEDTIDVEDFRQIISFIREFADNHHHGKEEAILFKEALALDEPAAEKLIRHGMLVEHDLGRFHVGEMEAVVNEAEQLDAEGKLSDELKVRLIGHMESYRNLLRRHIEKEDAAVFSFLERSLNPAVLRSADIATDRFEGEFEERRRDALETLATLQDKYR